MTWLSVVTLLVALVLAVGLAVALRLIGQLRRRAAELGAALAALPPVPVLAPDLQAAFGTGPRRLIVIEVLNPLEVAGQRVRLGSLFGSVAPDTVRRIVVDEAAKEVMEKLASEGVEAAVSVHAGR